MQRNQVATSYYSLQNRKNIYLTQIHDSAATVCTFVRIYYFYGTSIQFCCRSLIKPYD